MKKLLGISIIIASIIIAGCVNDTKDEVKNVNTIASVTIDDETNQVFNMKSEYMYSYDGGTFKNYVLEEFAKLNFEGEHTLAVLNRVNGYDNIVNFQFHDKSYYLKFNDSKFEQIIRDKLLVSKEKKLTIADLAKIENLELNDSGITNVEELKYCTNLSYLNIKNVGMNEIIIPEMPKLDRVNISSIKMNSISLKNEPALTMIAITNSQISSLIIGNSPKLENFSIKKCTIQGLDFKSFKNIRGFSYCDSEIKEIDLSEFTSVRFLELTGNKLNKIIFPKDNEIEFINSYKNTPTK